MKPIPTLRQLRYLVALADHSHFGHAAEACLVTQSTLSAGLQELEALLGAVLVERTKRRVVITPLGEEVVARARRLLQGAEEVVELVQAASEPLSGPLRLGVIPTVGPFLLPKILPALRQDHPRIRLYLREDLTARLLDRLGSGDLDLVLLALPYRAEEFEMVSLFDDPFVLACPAGHPLADHTSSLESLAARPDLLLLEEGHCLREHALAACGIEDASAPGRAASERVLATSLTTLVQMVAGGLGVTLLPRMALDILTGTGLVYRDLGSDAPARSIGLAWRSSSPRQAEFRLMGEAIRSIQGPVDRVHGRRAAGPVVG